jgi:lysophospholipase L1-like esterase
VDVEFLPSIRLPFSIKNKYLAADGNLIDNSDCNSTPKIPISGYDRLYLSDVYIGALAYGIFFDVNGNIVSRFQNDGTKQTLSIPNGAASVQLSNFTSLVANPIVCLTNTSFFEQPFNKKTQRDDEIVYKSVVRKPFVFSEKTSVFTGDSITYGFTDPEHIVYGTGDYPTLFSNAVGMTYSNISVGGATITENVTGAAEPSITQQVKNASKNIDYLFIAGGINDWQAGVPYSTFKQAIDSLCDYINENYASSVQVILITPINNGGRPYSSPELDLQIYRNIMTTEILGHDTDNRFSIIQGNEFPFPSEYDNTPDGVAIMFGDQLHPSAIGYQWYAAFLKTLLL